jgi:transcription antitermination factor NusG
MKHNKSSELEPKWYPFYTRSRFEKKALLNLQKGGYEAFLPLKPSERTWSDRKKIVEMPLFSSYIFVKVPKYKLYDVLQVYGIVRYIVFNGQPATVKESEIELIKKILSPKIEVEVIDGAIEEGAVVKLTSGIFNGYNGKVVKLSGKNKVVIQIESINKSLLITMDKSNLTLN